MKILLVRPPIILKVARRLQAFLHLEPLSLEIVAGGIPEGHSVQIIDLASTARARHKFDIAIKAQSPDLVGFTAYSNQAAEVKELARRVKAIIPKAQVAAGGVHATIVPQDFHLPGIIDFVIRGEGGSVIGQLVSDLAAKKQISSSPTILVTASPSYSTFAEKPPPPWPEYKAVPLPRRNLVKRDTYHCIWHGGVRERLPELFPRTASVRTSVGCPNRCNFCVVHYLAQGKYRQREPQTVVDEISSLSEEHIYFVDDEMFINPKRTEKIARLLIQSGIRKKYISWARADTICAHPELFKLWKKAGLSLLYVGLESMEDQNLKAYNKGINADVNYRAVELLREIGIGLHAALMVNSVFSREDFAKLRRSMASIGPAEMTFTVFSPAPGTELWEKHKEQFICQNPYTFYDCMHTLLPTKLPLKEFYSQYALLFLYGVRYNPWRHNRVKVKWRDLFRFFYRGALYGNALRNIYKDYPDN